MTTAPQPPQPTVTLYGAEAFEGMRRAGQLAARVLDHIAEHVVPGVTTGALDDRMDAFMRDHGAVPATLGYKGYPKSSCISINHVVCHGIPGDKKLQDGDILNIDVTVILDGWYGDTSRMFFAGDRVSVKARKLCQVTHDCLARAIAVVRPGATLGDIGHAIQTHAEANRFSVVREKCGQGVGDVFRAPPATSISAIRAKAWAWSRE